MTAIQQGGYLAGGDLLLRGLNETSRIGLGDCSTVALGQDNTGDAH